MALVMLPFQYSYQPLFDMIEKLSLNKFLNYGYSGFLLLGIIYLNDNLFVRSLVENLGPVISVILTLSLGATAFIAYRYILGELLIYPLVHVLHKFISPKTSTLVFLKDVMSVKYNVFFLRNIYNSIRRRFFSKELLGKLDLAHAEIHVIYVTSIQLIGNFFYLTLHKPNDPNKTYWLVLGLIFLAVGMVADMWQHSNECGVLKRIKNEKVEGVSECSLLEFLDHAGIKLERAQTKDHNP